MAKSDWSASVCIVIIIFSSFDELPSDDTDCVDVAASCNNNENYIVYHADMKNINT